MVLFTRPKSSPSVTYTLCPERDLSLGQRRMAIFEDCQATMLTTQPPQLANPHKYAKSAFENFSALKSASTFASESVSFSIIFRRACASSHILA